MAVPTKRFNFTEQVEIKSASNPNHMHSIPAGVHEVVFESTITNGNNAANSECEVRQVGISAWRILRTDLNDLCQAGTVVPVP